jgi:8-oxo-dGTP pyrophosphatase MutT (NUDIX family)
MQNSRIIASLKEELQKPLPGLKAQQEMVPLSRRKDLESEPVNPKKGGVLLLIYEDGPNLMLVFIERTDDGGVHSRQISFPGGKFEFGDKDLIHTSLREAEEEVGIDAANVQVLGKLTQMFIPVSNFLVSPTVGFYKGKPNFKPNPTEVAEILEVSLQHLMNDQTRRIDTVDVRGRKFEVPVFHVNHHNIWGATAMMLNEFIQVVKRINGKV